MGACRNQARGGDSIVHDDIMATIFIICISTAWYHNIFSYILRTIHSSPYKELTASHTQPADSDWLYRVKISDTSIICERALTIAVLTKNVEEQ